MSRYFRLALCLFLLLTSTLFVSAQESEPKTGASQIKGTRRALLIAVSNYVAKKDFSATPSADEDVELMKKELLDSGFGSDNIRVLQNSRREMPSREKIEKSIKEFAESCGSEDLAFIMLAGRGLYDAETQKDYFLPIDAKTGDFSSFVPLDFVVETLGSCGAKFKWLLVDAYREIGKDSSDGSSWGKLDAKPGMLIFQSSEPGEISYTTNSDGSGNNLFVYRFVEGLQGEAIGADGRVSVLAAFEYARDKIKDRQRPVMSSKDVEDFVLNENEEWKQAAKMYQRSEDSFNEGDFSKALTLIQGALFLDSPLHDAYLKKAEQIRKSMKTNVDESGELPEDYVDMNGGEYRLIKAGSFTMGTKLTGEEVMKKYPNPLDAERFNNAPAHPVTLTQDFYLCKYPVTVGEFRKFVDATGYKTTAEKEGNAFTLTADGSFEDVDGANWKNPGIEQTDAHPVVCVSYEDALAYIEWLNDKSQVDDKLGGLQPTYRLPTEAEWEYSCRAGTTGEFFWGGNDERDGKGYLNGTDTTKSPTGKDWSYHFSFSDGYFATSPVGSFKSNPWGLYDMLGNVFEWTSDWYGDYPADDATDPTGASTGSYRVLRGGGWGDGPADCRCAYRIYGAASNRVASCGFRVAFSLTSK